MSSNPLHSTNRREFLHAAAGVALTGPVLAATQAGHAAHAGPASSNPVEPLTPQSGTAYMPVVFPNSGTLPWTMEDGVKVFRLVCEPVRREFAPGLVVNAWGYNGESPGPAIEAVEGDRVRFLVTNKLPIPTTVHWHGLFLPNGMDGIGGLTQPSIGPGQTFRYEYTLRQHGTFMYHPHFAEMLQMGMGMMGMFIVHPKTRALLPVERDFGILLNEWAVAPGAATPDATEMTNFNLFTFNGKVFPATAPLVVRLGQRVRIRIANLSMTNAHPIHLHGFSFKVTGTDGGAIPESAQWPEVTVNVPSGATRDIEFLADAEGDWGLHCHKVHHLMNGMGHNLPITLGLQTSDLDARLGRLVPGLGPAEMVMGGEMMEMGRPQNTIGSTIQGPFGAVDAGGMFTVVKVRAGITDDADPGWYKHPAGTVAGPV